MPWIVERFDGRENENSAVCDGLRWRAPKGDEKGVRGTDALEYGGIAPRLLRLGRLVTGTDFFSGLLQNASNLIGIGSAGGQFQILLVSRSAIRRKHNALRLGIDCGLLDESLSLDVVKDRQVRIRLVWVGLDGLVGCSHLRGSVVLLEENDRLIAQVQKGVGRVGLCSSIVCCIRISNLSCSSVDLAQTGIGESREHHREVSLRQSQGQAPSCTR